MGCSCSHQCFSTSFNPCWKLIYVVSGPHYRTSLVQISTNNIPFFPPLKDSELTELKDTIDILKVKNTEAQEIIQGAFSNPDTTPKGIEYAAFPHIDWIC